MDSLEMRAMDTTFYIAISNSDISNWQDSITALLHYFDREFSRFRTNNELWRLNQLERNGTTTISPILYDLLKRADNYFSKTDGRFSPYLLTQLEVHGYDQSFPFETTEKPYVPINYQTNTQPIIFLGNGRVKKNTTNKIDLGGIAKGYAVEATAKWLKKNARSKFGIVDGGGDMAVWSNGEKTWKIGIMDPFNDEKEIGSFEIQNGGVATSNIVYRSWWQDGIKKHHLLDGRTGLPVEPKIVQATVVSHQCLDAEIAAKICFMEEPMSVNEVIKRISNQFNFLLVKPDGELMKGGNH
ncbi:FAD:protein FMN transferase [Pseudoneobacillus sp. C159]